MDAAYCYYTRSSVVCLSVCLTVTIVSSAITAEPIEMPFDVWTRVGPSKHVLDGVQLRLNRPRAVATRTFCQITMITFSFLLFLRYDYHGSTE